MAYLIDLFLHLDVHLAEFVAQYGTLVYAGLFAVIFAETGLVVTPFPAGRLRCCLRPARWRRRARWTSRWCSG
jgi:hypothetical protein